VRTQQTLSENSMNFIYITSSPPTHYKISKFPLDFPLQKLFSNKFPFSLLPNFTPPVIPLLFILSLFISKTKHFSCEWKHNHAKSSSQLTAIEAICRWYRISNSFVCRDALRSQKARTRLIFCHQLHDSRTMCCLTARSWFSMHGLKALKGFHALN
jgi:hypothetical protein